MCKGFCGVNYPGGLDLFGVPLGYLVVVGLSVVNCLGCSLLWCNCVLVLL